MLVHDVETRSHPAVPHQRSAQRALERTVRRTAWRSVPALRRGEARTPQPPGGYHAFISYARAVDAELAAGLQYGMQAFAKPWYRQRALRVFRDLGSLPPGSALWSALRDSLDASASLILLASTRSATSPWVEREIGYWVRRYGVNRLVIVLTDPADEHDGAPRDRATWDEERQDFDWGRSPSLTPALCGAFVEAPAYLDLGWARGRTAFSLEDDRFRAAVAALSAAVRGVPLDQLVGEDMREWRPWPPGGLRLRPA
ncbi:hypothetical protein DN069_35075 [Streptacidiphilus pinicola]|uniref:TIR domain-containing protein n=1 Tax=Streptacidiphilus pinicola TaxID=2219663 RepID=A0A2X0J132_9ACTN|nr:TIR domain-containing protein [Streptacidiphilus pinicola]RAG81028.1 hypothetical protein DN069_35075 [Streptacidiphilus pinicola]